MYSLQNMPLYLFLVLPIAYALVLLWLVLKWKQLEKSDDKQNIRYKGMVSVIVPARNEEHTLPSVLNCLLGQESAPEFEVLVVNDLSTDHTARRVMDFIDNNPGFPLRLITPLSGHGKKNAVTWGVEESRGEIILCTDADCRPSVRWVENMTRPFTNSHVVFAFGTVAISGKGPFAHFQSYELSVLNAIGGIMAEAGRPGMANAANMAYRKSAFKQVCGYVENEHVPTGDDEFLLNKIHREFPHGIRFVQDKNATITTSPHSSLSDMVNQKKRWASKWDKHGNPWPALLVFIVNLYFLFLPAMHLFGIIPVEVPLISFYLKIVGELLLIAEIRNSLNLKTNGVYLILSSILYPLYAMAMGIIANFGTYTWKKRKYLVKQER